VEQRNGDGLTPPYMAAASAIVDVQIVPSAEPPTGVVGSPVPVIAPAVVKAPATLPGDLHGSRGYQAGGARRLQSR
jgi:hypothetical protein